MIRMTYSISIHHLTTQIRYQRDIDRTNTALGYRCITPGIMREMRIYRYSDYFYVTLLKIFCPVRMRNNFRWTDKGKIQGIEKQYCIFVTNMRMKIEILIEITTRQNSRFSKIGGRSSDECRHYFSF